MSFIKSEKCTQVTLPGYLSQGLWRLLIFNGKTVLHIGENLKDVGVLFTPGFLVLFCSLVYTPTKSLIRAIIGQMLVPLKIQ